MCWNCCGEGDLPCPLKKWFDYLGLKRAKDRVSSWKSCLPCSLRCLRHFCSVGLKGLSSEIFLWLFCPTKSCSTFFFCPLQVVVMEETFNKASAIQFELASFCLLILMDCSYILDDVTLLFSNVGSRGIWIIKACSTVNKYCSGLAEENKTLFFWLWMHWNWLRSPQVKIFHVLPVTVYLIGDVLQISWI